MARISADGSTEQRFSITVPSGESSFRYRVLAGNKLSQAYHVTVTPRPEVERLDVAYDYPSYTKVPPRVDAGSTGEITGVVGTGVTVTAAANKPLASAQMLINGVALPDPETKLENGKTICSWRLVLEPTTVGSWSIKTRDRYGLANVPGEYKIKAVPDQPPSLKVLDPAASKLTLRPTERLPVHYVARDDYGIAAAHLLVEVDDKKLAPIAVEPPTPSAVEQGAWRGRAVLNLAALELGSARTVRFRLRVSDALPPSLKGPQHATSEAFEIQLYWGTTTYTERAIAQKEADVRKALTLIQYQLQRTRTHSYELDQQVAARPKELNRYDLARIDGLRENSAKADTMLRELAEQIEWTAFDAISKKSKEIADEHTTPARKEAELIKLAEKPGERAKHAKTADTHVADAQSDVQKLLGELKDISDRIRLAKKLEDLAERERELAAAARAKTEEAKAAPTTDEKWQKEQTRLAGDVAKSVKESPGALHEALEQKREQAKDLAAEADKLAGEQKDLKDITDKTQSAPPKSEDIRGELLKHITEAQKEIAKETADTAKKVDKEAPSQNTEHHEAAKSTQQTADQLEQNELSKAAQTGDHAAQQLDHVAANLSGEKTQPAGARSTAEAQPATQGKPAEQGKPGEQGQPGKEATQPEQGEQGQDTKPGEKGKPGEQGEQTAQSGDSKPHPALAKKAGELARRQKNVVEQIKALAGGDLEKALGLMQKDVGERAAELAEGAKQVEQQAGELGAAGEAQKQAHEAAGELDQATRKAEEAAHQAGMPSQSSVHAPSSFQPALESARRMKQVIGGDADVSDKLRKLGLATDDWLRLPSELRNQILQSADDRAPEEYRALVKRHFRELAKRGSSSPESK